MRWLCVLVVGFAIAIAIILVLRYAKHSLKTIVLPSKHSEIELLARDPFSSHFSSLRQQLSKEVQFPKIAIIDSGASQAMLEYEDVPGHELGDGGGDELGHGTGILLQLAAQANQFGVLGYLPETDYFSYKLASGADLITGNVPMESVERAIDLADRGGVKIIVMSLSNRVERWPAKAFAEMLKKAEDRILFVVAGGNDGEILSYGPNCPYVPICISAPNLIKVGATDAGSSNRGPAIDVSVPSKANVWRQYRRTEKDQVFEIREVSSTSVATPKVVALAALIWAKAPMALPSIIKTSLMRYLN